MSEAKTWHPLHLNDIVRVRLNEEGLRIYRARVEALNASLPPWAKGFPLEPRVDEEGYYRTSLWELMQDFGQHIHLGRVPPFEALFAVRTS